MNERRQRKEKINKLGGGRQENENNIEMNH
jgi:hypothetical protein